LNSSALVRREPVVNGQQAITAARLVVRTRSAAAAVRVLNDLAGVWPGTREVLVGIEGAAPDEALLGWARPANALLEFPMPLFATAAGHELACRFDAAGIPLCLSEYAPDVALHATPKFHFTLADARVHPQLPRTPALPLAIGLADHDAFAAAVDGGYAGAAGWFFLRGLPSPLPGRLNPTHVQIIQVLNLVRENADIEDIETALKRDIGISFKLLRYINSAGFGLATKINSFRHAVTMIGFDKLNKWLSLLLVTASRDPAAPALMQTAIARGRFMELVAAARGDCAQLDNLFIAGSFSLLDMLLGLKFETVLKEINLPAALVDALLYRTGPYAPYLDLALACEQPDCAQLLARAEALGVAPETLNRAQVEALAFADGLQLD
jgi:hypothetical protein